MTDDLVKRLRGIAVHSYLGRSVIEEAADRIEQLVATNEQLTEERDAAYASGYSDAETEISQSVLGLENTFLHSQYADAVEQIKDLNELLDDALAEWRKYSIAWMTAEGKLADAESDIDYLHKLLAEAASDLTSYVNAEYPPETCAQYPDIARRHHRDMDLVRRIEAELKVETP